MPKSLVEIFRYYTEEEGISSDVAAQLIVADALHFIARALNNLGTADATTSMGGLEIVAKELKAGLAELSAAISSLTQK